MHVYFDHAFPLQVLCPTETPSVKNTFMLYVYYTTICKSQKNGTTPQRS